MGSVVEFKILDKLTKICPKYFNLIDDGKGNEVAMKFRNEKAKCPFEGEWSYVTVVIESIGGVQTQKRLWKNKKTKELRWEKL